MDPVRKKRLVGSFVLLLVAAILVPFLFDGEGYRANRLILDIPPEPEPLVLQFRQPESPRLSERSALADPRPQPEPVNIVVASAPLTENAKATPQTLSLSKDVPVQDTDGVPVAWTLQLASFRDEVNAKQLRDRLNQAGYKSYLRSKGAMTKVFVGPDLQRTEVEKQQAALSKLFKLNGLVLRFTPG